MRGFWLFAVLLLLLGCQRPECKNTPDYCNLQMATDSNDSSYCEAIHSPKLTILCHATVGTNLIGSCNRAASSLSRDYCYGATAVMDNDLQLCSLISSKTVADDCTYAIAMKTNTSESCTFINRLALKDSCYSNLAIGENNPILCEQVANVFGFRECLAKVAYNLHNSNLCSISQEAVTQDACQRLVNCKMRNSSWYLYDCTQSAAVSLGIPGLCDINKNPSWKDLCSQTVSEKFGTPFLCQNIADGGKKVDCYMDIAKATGDYKLCDKIEAGVLRDQCYGYSARDNPTNCSSIPNLVGRNNCFVSQAKQLKSAVQCEMIAPGENDFLAPSKDSCFETIAILTKNITTCEMISKNSDLYNTCLVQVSFQVFVPNTCSKITDIQQRDECYYSQADKTLNTSYCDLMGQAWLKKQCVKEISCYQKKQNECRSDFTCIWRDLPTNNKNIHCDFKRCYDRSSQADCLKDDTCIWSGTTCDCCKPPQ